MEDEVEGWMTFSSYYNWWDLQDSCGARELPIVRAGKEPINPITKPTIQHSQELAWNISHYSNNPTFFYFLSLHKNRLQNR